MLQWKGLELTVLGIRGLGLNPNLSNPKSGVCACRCLRPGAPDPEDKLARLSKIAQEHGVKWDVASASTEILPAQRMPLGGTSYSRPPPPVPQYPGPTPDGGGDGGFGGNHGYGGGFGDGGGGHATGGESGSGGAAIGAPLMFGHQHITVSRCLHTEAMTIFARINPWFSSPVRSGLDLNGCTVTEMPPPMGQPQTASITCCTGTCILGPGQFVKAYQTTHSSRVYQFRC